MIYLGISHGLLEAVDRAVLSALRVKGDLARPLGPAWLAETGRDITGLGSNGVLALVVSAASILLIQTRRRLGAATLIVAFIVSEGLCTVLKIVVHRARPDFIPDVPRVFTTSFPSSHAMISAAVLFTLASVSTDGGGDPELRRSCFGIAFVLTGLIGLSRLYLGVHWPSDVCAGWVAGLFCAWACSTGMRTRAPSVQTSER